MQVRDKLGIYHDNESDIPDYNSIYLRKLGKSYDDSGRTINEYGASDDADIEKLPLLSCGKKGSAAPGSSCLFHSGRLFILGVNEWDEYRG